MAQQDRLPGLRKRSRGVCKAKAERGFGMSRTLAVSPEFVVRDGKPTSVILPICQYEELLERLEDTEDLRWLRQARKKPLRFRPLDAYLTERSRRV